MRRRRSAKYSTYAIRCVCRVSCHIHKNTLLFRNHYHFSTRGIWDGSTVPAGPPDSAREAILGVGCWGRVGSSAFCRQHFA